MVSVLQAESMILDNIFPSAEEWMPLQNLGDEWLTQDLKMNQHDPQFHRATVDGMAIAWRIWQAGHRFFPITEVEPELAASLSLAKPFESFQVKAGDNLPAGTDCVVPLASVTIHDDMACISNSMSLRRWDHVQRMGFCSGIEKVFRAVAQQPGAEFFFGLGPNQQFVFGLPCDPSASLMIAHRFILPALTSMVSGQRPFSSKGQPRGVLTQQIYRDSQDTSYIPVTIRFNQSGSIDAQPLTMDIGQNPSNMLGSDGFVEIASREDVGNDLAEKQEAVPLWLWRQPWI